MEINGLPSVHHNAMVFLIIPGKITINLLLFNLYGKLIDSCAFQFCNNLRFDRYQSVNVL